MPTPRRSRAGRLAWLLRGGHHRVRLAMYAAFVVLLMLGLILYWQKRYADKSPFVYISISSLGGSFLVLGAQGMLFFVVVDWIIALFLFFLPGKV